MSQSRPGKQPQLLGFSSQPRLQKCSPEHVASILPSVSIQAEDGQGRDKVAQGLDRTERGGNWKYESATASKSSVDCMGSKSTQLPCSEGCPSENKPALCHGNWQHQWLLGDFRTPWTWEGNEQTCLHLPLFLQGQQLRWGVFLAGYHIEQDSISSG